MTNTSHGRGRSTSSSPDPLGGTPRISTQSTDRDRARSPETTRVEIEPGCYTAQDFEDVGSPLDPEDRNQEEREQEAEEEEDSRESPSFEGVNFSSGFDVHPAVNTSITSPAHIEMKAYKQHSSDATDDSIQQLKARSPLGGRCPAVPNLGHMPQSRYPISSQLPSATLVNRTPPPSRQHQHIGSPRKHRLGRKQEPPGRSRSTRFEDRLVSHPIIPPKNLALATITLDLATTVAQAGNNQNNIFEDPESSGSVSLEFARAEPFPRINRTVSSFRTKRFRTEDEDEDSIEALRNHGPIRSFHKDSSRYIYGLPGSSTLFGSDWMKADTSRVEEDDGGGGGFGGDLALDTGMAGTSVLRMVDTTGEGLTRRRRSEASGGDSKIEAQGQQFAPGNQLSSDVPFGPSSAAQINPETSAPHFTEVSKGLRTIIERDIDHRTLSTRRAPRRRPSFVYMPPGRRRNTFTAELPLPSQSTDEDEQELPSLNEIELPQAPKGGLTNTRKRSLPDDETEDHDDDYMQDRAPKKKRTKQRKARDGKPVESVEKTDSERKAVEDRLRQIQEIDAYELEVVYDI